MSNEALGKVRIVGGRLEIEPINQEAESLMQEAKQVGRKVRVLTEAPEECALDPGVPAVLTTCAALEDLNASAAGELDTVDLLDRMIKRALLREQWERGELDDFDLYRLEDQ